MIAASTTASTTASEVTTSLLSYSNIPRNDTDWTFLALLEKSYPGLHIATARSDQIQLQKFAAAGHASITPLSETHTHVDISTSTDSVKLSPNIFFGSYTCTFASHHYTIYISQKAQPLSAWSEAQKLTYIIAEDEARTEELLIAVATWMNQSHHEIWMYDRGVWQRSAQLWKSVAGARWEDVILDEPTKGALKGDVERFFGAREVYEELGVPWKRGIILHGPPGNGKTISIKSLMSSLHPQNIQSLYVKSLKACDGPEYAIREIFVKARTSSPCLLVFEDIDSFITNKVRSYFLNEIDGLESNDGILMLGSTNHLDRLDPSVSKRPSRFDRKYFFALPDKGMRERYVKYWQGKLESKVELGFADKVVGRIADVTEGFSFAYLKELFVASLLAIAHAPQKEDGEEKAKEAVNGGMADHESGESLIWRTVKKEVEILRAEMMAAEEAEAKVDAKKDKESIDDSDSD